MKTKRLSIILITALITVFSVFAPFFAVKNSYADEVGTIGSNYYLEAQRLYGTTGNNNENQFDISTFNRENAIKDETNGTTFTSSNGDLTGKTIQGAIFRFNTDTNTNKNGLVGFNIKLKEAFPSALIGQEYRLLVEETNIGTKRIYLYQANLVWNFGEAITITDRMLESDIYLYGRNEQFRQYDSTYTTAYIKGMSIVLSNADYTTWKPSPTTYYNIGYRFGYTDGNNAGIETGTEQGYNNGYDNGYTQGYIDGQDGTIQVTETIFPFYQEPLIATGQVVTINEQAQTITWNGTPRWESILIYPRDTTLFANKFTCRAYYEIEGTDYNITHQLYIGYATVTNSGSIVSMQQLWSLREDGLWTNINFPKLASNQYIYIKVLGNSYTFSETDPPHITYQGLRLIKSGTIDTVYASGYTDGYKNGQANGLEEGKKQANENAYNTGYNAGVIEGASNSNKYTFLGLVSATVDGVIQPLVKMFNFDLLGFNMSGLIMSLFTLFVIITVLRLILG